MSHDATLTVIVPTFNEGPNIAELVRRIGACVDGRNTEILFVDDSTDDTAEVIRRAAVQSAVPVRLLHREQATGGLSGAVIDGLASSRSDWCIVMDGDLQHPPELIPVLVATGDARDVDLVVASRHIDGGSSAGLENPVRRLVSRGATALARALFPIRLRAVSDPMTGYFAVRSRAVDVDRLRPRGFKILLEILVANAPRAIEVPFVFGRRTAGVSKADLGQGTRFLAQLFVLRLGRRPVGSRRAAERIDA
ncbi:polyprenol monophosphomannose synthase [Microbacteriaceae bacterium VKM Ac-2854]|nr:polyprenol monophosphomannose synthase [Microbacteriaceae bacterium VKM Ac-2854]